jgi:hypothetical protein
MEHVDLVDGHDWGVRCLPASLGRLSAGRLVERYSGQPAWCGSDSAGGGHHPIMSSPGGQATGE